jgi:branched-chain amino acid transport system permease protein
MVAPMEQRLTRWLPELSVAIALVILPFIFDIGFGSVDLFTRILIWGIFGLGFDLLFGYAGLLSFGQAAFYGTGGFVTAYLLTSGTMSNVWLAMAAGVAAATASSVLVGYLALRRVGIYFAMITLAFGELFYFLENSPLSAWTGGENGLPGIPAPSLQIAGLGITFIGSWPSYELIATFYFFGFLLARFIVLSPVGIVLMAIRQNPERTAALGHDVRAYKLVVFVLAAAYAACAGALLGIFQSYMPPSAFALQTSGQLVIQTVIGGAGSLIGPAIGATLWLGLREALQQLPIVGDLWKFILGMSFVLIITTLRNGVAGATLRLWAKLRLRRPTIKMPLACSANEVLSRGTRLKPSIAMGQATGAAPLSLDVRDIDKSYAGIHALDKVSLAVPEGSLHAIIGPNGAGKSTLLRLLAREEMADSGAILLHGSDITTVDVTTASQRGLSKSYQLNQLFPQLTARQNLRIGALSRQRGRLRFDIFRSVDRFPQVEQVVAVVMDELRLSECADLPVNSLAYGQKRRLELGLALASQPSVLLLDEPLAGLSPNERQEVRQLIRNLSKGRTIVLVEHDMDAVFELAGRVTVLHEGRKLAEGTADEIQTDSAVQDAYLGGVSIR